MNYTFVFMGETTHGVDTSIVKKKLAHKFNIPLSEADKFFDRESKFERKGISKEVALAYQEEFSEAGAVGHVLELIDSPRAQKSTSTATPPSRQNVDLTPVYNKNNASTWIKWAGILIVAVLAADEYLQTALIIDSYGLDIGYWPLILAHVPLIIGCSLLAQEKGRPKLLGLLLGFFSLAGLSILLLIPRKGDTTGNFNLVTLLVVAFNAGVFIYWINSFWSNNNNVDEFLTQADQLHIGRQEFPKAIQSDVDDYIREQKELYSFMEGIITEVQSNNLRANDITLVGNRMFSELARYSVWRNYQYFKHKTTNKRLAKALTNDFFKQDSALFKSLLSTVNQQTAPRLNEIKAQWLIGINGSEVNSIQARTGKKMGQIFDSVRDTNILNASDGDNQRNDIEQFILKLRLPEFPNSKLTRHSNYIEYSFDGAPLQGYRLNIGFYIKEIKPKLPFQQKSQFRREYIVISHQYPAKYLHKLLGVFNGYNSLH